MKLKKERMENLLVY